MKTYIILFVFLAFFSGCAANPYFVRYPPAMSLTANVLEVTDGDTILIENNGDTNSVRLLFIDAMETYDNKRLERKLTSLRKGGVYETKESLLKMGEAAKARLKLLLPPGSPVKIDFPSNELRDTYGRYLGVVFISETNCNYLMVKDGFAITYFPGKTSGSVWEYRRSFRKAEEAVKRQKTGVWEFFTSEN